MGLAIRKSPPQWEPTWGSFCGSRLQANHWKCVQGRPEAREVPRHLRNQRCLRAICLQLSWFLSVSSSDPKGPGGGQDAQGLTSGLLTRRPSSGHRPPPPCGFSCTATHPGLPSDARSQHEDKRELCGGLLPLPGALGPSLSATGGTQSLTLKGESCPRLPLFLSHLGPQGPAQVSMSRSWKTNDGLLALEQQNETTACAHRGSTI